MNASGCGFDLNMVQTKMDLCYVLFTNSQHHLLVAQVLATAPPCWKHAHHKHLFAQRSSYDSGVIAPLYPLPNCKSFLQDYPRFQRPSKILIPFSWIKANSAVRKFGIIIFIISWLFHHPRCWNITLHICFALLFDALLLAILQHQINNTFWILTKCYGPNACRGIRVCIQWLYIIHVCAYVLCALDSICT